MSEWTEIQPFIRDQITFEDGSALDPIQSATNADNSIAPSIIATTDFLLRDQIGDLITDQNNESISLEGLTYATIT